MCAATEILADVVGIGANIETLAANDAKIDFRQADGLNLMGVDMHKARFALHGLALAGELVERHAVFLDRTDHGRGLVEVAMEF